MPSACRHCSCQQAAGVGSVWSAAIIVTFYRNYTRHKEAANGCECFIFTLLCFLPSLLCFSLTRPPLSFFSFSSISPALQLCLHFSSLHPPLELGPLRRLHHGHYGVGDRRPNVGAHDDGNSRPHFQHCKMRSFTSALIIFWKIPCTYICLHNIYNDIIIYLRAIHNS